MKIPWPPKPHKIRVVKGVQQNGEGDTTVIPLKRQPHDQALRGQLWNTCCDCDLTHFITFEVFRDKTGHFFLNKRAYRR